AAVAVGAVVAVQAARSLVAGGRPSGEVLTHRVAAAGRWLGQHNTGGNIISTPYMNPGITNRAVLAMGGYTGLQSYGAFRIAHPRSLPPAGRQPLLDPRHVLLHPAKLPVRWHPGSPRCPLCRALPVRAGRGPLRFCR